MQIRNLLDHWDEVFSGLQFVLARKPDLFRKVGEGPLRVASVQCYRSLPAIHVLFAYDDLHVYLLDVYLCDTAEED